MRSIFLQQFQIAPNLRRYLSAGLALCLVGGILAVPLSMLDGCHQRRDEIELLKMEVGRLSQRSASLVERETVEQTTVGGTADIVAPDIDVAAAHLQTVLRGLATSIGSTDVRVDSVRILPSIPDGALTAVRVSATLTVPANHIYDVINVLEAARPPIVIDSLRVSTRSDTNEARIRSLPGSEIARAELSLALRVYASSPLKAPGTAVPDRRRSSRAEGSP